MKKALIVALVFFMAFGLYAQTIDTNLLDLSRAKVSIAGPQNVYIRSIYYSGKELSVLLKYSGNDSAKVYGPYYEKDKLLLDSYRLDYAKLKVSGENEILVSDLIIGNQGYSGMLKWTGDSTLVVDRYWKSSTPVTEEVKIDKLTKELAELKAKYETEVSSLKGQLSSLKSTQVSMVKTTTTMKSTQRKPETVILSGFNRGKAVYGNWNVSYNSVKQTNNRLKFAKYSIPVYQNRSVTSYAFTAKADSTSGWIGYGLHFFASGEKTGRGYGFGRSYLVWLTRDSAYFKSNNTYLQLYESYNDIKMIQLASVKIPSAINSTINTEILYDKSAGKIYVSVNGENVLTFNPGFPIVSGNKIAFRTLGGPVQFTELKVKVQ